jgi:hypoxanthine-guanine phosphoribosyltransferase
MEVRMDQIFGKPFVTQEAMRARIKELGKQISQDYQGKDLLVVGVLKGAYVFFADLVRVIRLPIPVLERKGRVTTRSESSSDRDRELLLIYSDLSSTPLTDLQG